MCYTNKEIADYFYSISSVFKLKKKYKLAQIKEFPQKDFRDHWLNVTLRAILNVTLNVYLKGTSL